MAFTEDVRIPIIAEDRASVAFKQIRAAGDRLLQKFEDLGNRVTNFNQGLEILGKAGRGAAAVLNVTAGNFADFETALTGVQKTTDLSGNSLRAFGETIQRLSTEIPVASEDLLGIATTAGQLGVSGSKNLENFVETVAKVGVATDLTADQAATSFARILNVANESIDNIDEFASVVVRLGNTFETTESEIVRVANEVGRSVSQFDVASEKVAAISTALRSLGVQAQLGGSVVGKAFRTINDAINDGGQQLEDLAKFTGLTVEQIRKNFAEDAVSVFQVFVEAVGKSGRRASDELAKFGLKGDEVNKVLPVLASRSDKLAKALELAAQEMENATALNEEARKAFATLSSETQKTLNTFTSIATNIGALFAPALKILLQTLNSIGQALLDVSQAAIKLSDAFIILLPSAVAALAVMAPATLGSISAALLTMGGNVLALGKSFALLSVSLGVVALKFTVIASSLALVTTAIELVIRNTDKLSKVWTVVGSSIELVINSVRLTILDLVRSVIEMISRVVPGLTGLLDQADKELNVIFESMQTNIKDIEEASKDLDLGVGAGSIAKLTEMISGSEMALKAVEEQAEKTGSSLAKTFGPAGPTAKQLEEQRKLAERVAKAQAREQAAARDRAIEQAEQAFQALVNGTAGMEFALEKQNATTRQLIDIEKRERLKAIDDFVAKQKAAGKVITEDQKKQIEAFKTAAEAEAESKRTEAGIGAASPFGGGAVEAIGDVMGGFASGLSSALTPVTAIMSAANAVVGALQQVIDFIPQILDSITKLFTSLTKLPLEILRAFKDLFAGITDFIKDFIPNLLTAAFDLVEAALDFLIEGLPDAFNSLMERLPELIEGLIQRLPELAFKFGQSLLTNINFAVLAIKFTVEMTKQIPKLIIAFVKEVPAIVTALVDGMVLALKEAINELSNLLGLGDIFNIDVGAITDQLSEIGDTISKSVSNVFEVIDLEAAARGLDVADRIRDAITSSTRQAVSWLENLWNKLVDFVRKAFKFVEDLWNALKGIVEAAWQFVSNLWEILKQVVATAWQFVQNLWDTLLMVVSQAWQFVQNLWDALAGIVSTAWQFVQNLWDNLARIVSEAWEFVKGLFDGLKETVETAWKFVKEKIIDPLGGAVKTVFDGLKDALNNIKKPFEDLKDAFNKILGPFQSLTDALNKFKPPRFSAGGIVGAIDRVIPPGAARDAVNAVGGAVQDVGSAVGGAFGLAKGGLVPENVLKLAQGGIALPKGQMRNGTLYAQTGAFAPTGTDTIPAMLTPGEFVVNRESTAANIGLLSAINSIKNPVTLGGGTTNIAVTVNANSMLSPEQINREVVPRLKQELKKASLRGDFLISQRGIR